MTLDVKSFDPCIIPHKIWIELWKIYRENNCPIDEMHCILCDFDNIRRLHVKEPEDFEFYWYYEPGYSWTTFTLHPGWNEEFGVHVKKIGHLIEIEKVNHANRYP